MAGGKLRLTSRCKYLLFLTPHSLFSFFKHVRTGIIFLKMAEDLNEICLLIIKWFKGAI
jgi:hypothetical protein